LYAVVYGTGKWARLIGEKLKLLNVAPVFVGSNSERADFARDDPGLLQNQNCPVFVASATQNHLSDVEHCIKLNPSKIFVEKGFVDSVQRARARELTKHVPAYVINQRIYSSVFDVPELDGKILQCEFDWCVDVGNTSEWAYHMVSIDNYIRKLRRDLYITQPGTCSFDPVTVFSIREGAERLLRINVTTDNSQLKFELGHTNQVSILTTPVRQLQFVNEDCLTKAIEDAILNTNKRMEQI